MTDPAGGGGGAPQSPSNWQPGGQAGGFQSAPIEQGPAPGIAYADLVTRIIAAIIDGIILFVPWAVVSGALITGSFLSGGSGGLLIMSVVLGVVWFVASAAYFIYTWTTMRASVGQKVLNLETVNAADGATITRDQAIRRYAFLFGLPQVAVILSNALGILGTLIALASLGYSIYLLYTASQSPKRQGFHDVQAGTVVVKRG